MKSILILLTDDVVLSPKHAWNSRDNCLAKLRHVLATLMLALLVGCQGGDSLSAHGGSITYEKVALAGAA